MMAAALGLALFAFWQLLGLPADARAYDYTAFDWIPRIPLETTNGIGLFQVSWGFRLDPAVRDDDPDHHRHRHADPRLLDGVHGGRTARRRGALLLLPEPVLLLMLMLVLGNNFLVMFVGWKGSVSVPTC